MNPQAPVHILLVPKKPLDMLSSAAPEDQTLLGHMLLVVGTITRQLNIDGAFRLVVNNGKDGGAGGISSAHAHMAGRKFHWPPG